MNSRDSMVGPWQVPVADCAVTMLSFEGYAGEAMAIGERTPLAVIDPAAASRIAIGEALTNIAAADVELRAREDFRQLDGGVRYRRRRREAVRRGQGSKRFVPGARHQRAGRQGFVVDENDLARRRAPTRRSSHRCR